MWEPLQRYRALDAEARRLFRRASVLFPLIGISLRLRGYKATQDWLQRRTAPQSSASANTSEQQKVEKTCRMVRAAQFYVPLRSTCLEQSLTLWYLLERQGIRAQVRIGVRKDAEKFEAHAWVEYNGVALNQPEEMHQHYSAFDSEFAKPPTERP